MLKRELGRTGVAIPEIGLGTWNYHAGAGPLRRGLACGALFIDTAESYGTECVVREAVDGMRDQVFIATKVSPHHFRADDLRQAVEGSLKRLGTEVIDLLQLHEPSRDIPIAETIGAMSGLVDAGKVRFIGVSNFSMEQLRDAQKASGKHPVVSNQVRYNLIDRTIEGGLLQYCQSNQVTVIAYSPLARGLDRIRDCDPDGVIVSLAKETERTATQIVLNWCLSRPGVVVIPKGNSEEHIVDFCGASGWRVSPSQLQVLESKIQYRHRTVLDTILRRYMPGRLRQFALKTSEYLPKGIRRRLR